MHAAVQEAMYMLQDRLLVLSLALPLSFIFTPALRRVLRLNAPAILLDRFIIRYDGKLNRDKRGTATRLYRGMVLMFALALMTGVLWLAMAELKALWRGALYLEIVWLAFLLGAGVSFSRARQIATCLRTQKLSSATQQLCAWRPVVAVPADAHSMARRSIESLIEDVSQRMLAVAVWYGLLGIAGAAWVAIVNRADMRIGYETDRYRAFGWSISAMQVMVQWLPCRLSAMLMVVASVLVPKGKPWAALRTVVRDRANVQQSHEGWVLATAAGALGIGLAGPKRVADSVKRDAWVGSGTAKANIPDLKRAIWLASITCLLVWLGVVGAVGVMG